MNPPITEVPIGWHQRTYCPQQHHNMGTVSVSAGVPSSPDCMDHGHTVQHYILKSKKWIENWQFTSSDEMEDIVASRITPDLLV